MLGFSLSAVIFVLGQALQPAQAIALCNYLRSRGFPGVLR